MHCLRNVFIAFMFHNVERDVCFVKQSCPLLVQLLFFVEFNPSYNETCQNVQLLLFMDLLEPSMLFVGGCKFGPFPLETSR